MKQDKPFWKRGDVLCLTNDLAPAGHSIWRGVYVFEADTEPVSRGGRWYMVFRPQEELRHATVEDIDRLIDLAHGEIRRVTEQETKEIERLEVLKAKLTLSLTTKLTGP